MSNSKPWSEIVCIATISASLCLGACASSSKDIDINKPIDVTKPVTGAEASNAEKAYKKGVEQAKGSNYIDATKYFEYVRNNFPYSQYAALSELALADMAFDRDDFGSAAAAYADFVKSHPSHPKADYAAYRIGVAHFSDRGSELFFYPPSHEKDQGPVRQALEALQKFEHTYPKSELLPQARQLMDECRERLAAHTRYVADFYWKRKAWRGAAGRYLELADAYGDLQSGSLRSDALWRAAESFEYAGQIEDERTILQRVIEDSPNGPHGKEAGAKLARIAATPPPQASLPPDAKGDRPDKSGSKQDVIETTPSMAKPEETPAKSDAPAPTPETAPAPAPETPRAPTDAPHP